MKKPTIAGLQKFSKKTRKKRKNKTFHDIQKKWLIQQSNYRECYGENPQKKFIAGINEGSSRDS